MELAATQGRQGARHAGPLRPGLRLLPADADAADLAADAADGARARTRSPRSTSRSRTSTRTRCRPTPCAARAGPEATHAIERMMDILAKELGITPHRGAPAQLPARSSRSRPRSGSCTTRATTHKTLDRLLELSDDQDDVRAAARGGGRARQAARPRPLDLGRGVRVRAVGRRPARARADAGRLGELDRAHAPDRQGHGHHRHLAARPGPRDVVVADHRDRARRAVRRRRGDPRRHGVRAVRARHVRQPQPGRRRHRRAPGRRPRCATRPGWWRPRCSRRRPTTSSSTTARSRSRAAPTSGSRSRRSRSAPGRRSTCPRA